MCASCVMSAQQQSSGAVVPKVAVRQDMPDKYIYEPWKAPPVVQATARCIVGKDYPQPIVDHAAASKANMVCPNTHTQASHDAFALSTKVLYATFITVHMPGQSGSRQHRTS